MKLTPHKYHLLKNDRNFQKLNVEFLMMTLAQNMQYIFLVLQLLSIFNIINFNLNPDHFPKLTISGELAVIKNHSFNPIYIYGHFLYVFYEAMRSLTLTFIDHVKDNIFSAGIIVIILVNMWLLYSGMSYGADMRASKRRNIIFSLIKDVLKRGNTLEDALWMMFIIDIIVFITTPTKEHILFLLGLYLVLLSIKITPVISNLIISASTAFQKSFFHNEKVLLVVTILDIAMVYFDSGSMFTLFLLILVYCTVATIILKLTSKMETVNKGVFYAAYFGLLVFLAGIFIIYGISFLLVIIAQLPLVIYFYKTKKKFVPSKVMQAVNWVFLIILLIYYF
ncbi:hypothetical protein KY308_03540 [Candidatus Woesearchaeota archaeon]|nr:hypothetical protein [Candidatus Woesearchaeota archaeon]